ncbi:MAG: apolipoprotein N-acyltransferase [Myxococcota bacterium]
MQTSESIAPSASEPKPELAPASRVTFPLSRSRATLLALACGVLYFLAFPGIDLWPFGLVALVPLRIALIGQTPRRAAFLGWVSGMTMVTLGFYWMLDMLQAFSGFSTPICVFFVLVVNAFTGGRMALFAWLFVRGERNGWPSGPWFLLAFVASELTFPVLFFWSFGGVAHPATLLTQVAELGGVYLVGLVFLAFNWAVSEALLARWRGERLAWRPLLPYALAPLLAAIYGAVRIRQVDARAAAAPRGEIGVVQANMGLMEKRQAYELGLLKHVEHTAALQAEKPLDFVLWSETSVMHALPAEDAASVLPRYFTRRLGVPTVFGAVLFDRVNDARQRAFYNSVLLTDAKGEIRGRYDKQELVPFSEHMPFGEDFPVLFEISPNSSNFRRGAKAEPLVLGEHRIAAMVCNDDVSPSLGNRLLADPETDLLVNLTNDAWFGDTTEPWIHLHLAKFRAIEHRRYFVRATNSGVSAFIDPVGRVLAQTKTFTEETLRHEVRWLKGRTVYEWTGDWLYWLGTLMVFVGAFLKRSRLAPRIS